MEHQKKKQQLVDLLEKRQSLVGKLKQLWGKIGQRKGMSLELDLNLPEKF